MPNNVPGTPSAYLNWVLLDEQFNYVPLGSGFQPVAGFTDEMTVMAQQISVPKSGYLFIYLSNETVDYNVYFDDLVILHTSGPLLQSDDYYPFGLEMKMLGSRAAGKSENKKKYSGNELQSGEFADGSGLDFYDFNARSYDQQIGRFLQIDPLTDEGGQESWNPYQYCFNNPISNVDPDGRFTITNHVAITNAALKYLKVHGLKNRGEIIAGVVKPDILNNQSDMHFDQRKGKAEIDNSWDKLNSQINESSGTIDLGEKLHTAQDFYSHSNYVELYIDFFKSTGGDISELKPGDIPSYGNATEDFQKYLTDQGDNFRTGDFDLVKNLTGGKKQKEANDKNPNHHDNRNKDSDDPKKSPQGNKKADGTIYNYFQFAVGAALNETIDIIKK